MRTSYACKMSSQIKLIMQGKSVSCSAGYLSGAQAGKKYATEFNANSCPKGEFQNSPTTLTTHTPQIWEVAFSPPKFQRWVFESMVKQMFFDDPPPRFRGLISPPKFGGYGLSGKHLHSLAVIVDVGVPYGPPL